MTAEKAKCMEEWPESRLWRFSCALYAQSAVKDACLYLQESINADVNLILYCLWQAKTAQHTLTPHQISQLETVIGPWRTSVIIPLRQTRKAVENSHAISENKLVRNKILQAEIEAEHAEQWLLEQQIIKRAGLEKACASTAARHSLETYLEQVAPNQPAECESAIKILLDAAFNS